MSKKSKFGLGLLLGAVGGALAGILYAPKSGKETREEASEKLKELRSKFSNKEIEKKAKQIFGKVTDETKDAYVNASRMLLERVADVRKRANSIDKTKYQKLVDGVVEDVKGTAQHSAKSLKLLRDNLASDWKKFSASSKKKTSSRAKKSNGKKK